MNLVVVICMGSARDGPGIAFYIVAEHPLDVFCHLRGSGHLKAR